MIDKGFKNDKFYGDAVASLSKEQVGKLKAYYNEGSKNGGTFGRGLAAIMDIQPLLVESGKSLEDLYEFSYHREFRDGAFQNSRFYELLEAREKQIQEQEMEEAITKRVAQALAKEKLGAATA
jgi:hypothetical protein